MSEQVPSVGRMVHCVLHSEKKPGINQYKMCCASIITSVVPSVVMGPDTQAVHAGWDLGLTVFIPGDILYCNHVSYDADGAPGTWHWPEFVPPKD